MIKFQNIFNQYERKGVPYRGRCDDINRIIKTLAIHMAKHDKNLNDVLVGEYCQLRFLKNINIQGDDCNLLYILENGRECSVSFSLVPEKLKKEFNRRFYDFSSCSYDFSGLCHQVTSMYLKLKSKTNIRAITSLCVSVDNLKYFHSYIWDVDKNLIIDFSKNIIMKKSDYDYVFVDREINVFSYTEYLLQLENDGYYDCGGNYCDLLYLALIKLHNEKGRVFKK